MEKTRWVISSQRVAAVRLGAARSVIELGTKLRETAEFEARLAALEQQIEPKEMLQTPTTSPLALNQPSVAALHATASGAPSAVVGVPSLASRDAVFVLLVQESLPRPGEPSIDLMAGGALTPPWDSRTAVADRAWTRAGASGGQKPKDPLPPLPLGSRQGFCSEHSAVGLLDGAWIDEESQASAWTTLSRGQGPRPPKKKRRRRGARVRQKFLATLHRLVHLKTARPFFAGFFQSRFCGLWT
jgi:hypothetical protein